MKKDKKKRIFTIIYHLVIIIVGLIMLYPLLWMIAGSFKSVSNVMTPSLIPDSLNLMNYIEGWKGFGGISFSIFFRNSFFISVTATIGQVFLSALVAYGFSRLNFPGKKFFFGMMIVSLLLPETILRIPQYIMFNELGWIDSFKPVILPRFFPQPFFVLVMVQYLKGISREIDKAAMVDGCSKYGVFFWVILPVLKPALTAAAIFSFYWTWNDFMSPLLYLQSTEKYPVSLALNLFSDPNTVTNWGEQFAMAVFSIIPILLIFLFLQKYIVEGVSTSGLKQ